MKKKLMLVFLTIIIFTILTSCTEKKRGPFVLNFNSETRECVVTNISDEDYQDLKLQVVVEDDKNFEKRYEENVGELEKNEDYKFQIEETENTTISNVYIKSYSYYVSTLIMILLWGVLVCNVVYLLFLISK